MSMRLNVLRLDFLHYRIMNEQGRNRNLEKFSLSAGLLPFKSRSGSVVDLEVRKGMSLVFSTDSFV